MGNKNLSKYNMTCMFQNMRFVLLIALVLGITGCSGGTSLSLFGGSKKPEITNAPKESDKKLYADADALLSGGKYKTAAKKFEEVDRLYPYSPFARRAIVMSAFAYQKDGSHPEAIKAAKNYRRLHPGTKESALAQHIIASSYYEQISDEDHDQSISRIALKELRTLIKRYPNSPYTAKARNRVRIVADVIAASEMKIGQYYRKRGNFLAAINRYKAVITVHQRTRHVEEALMRLTETYLALGVVNEAQTAAAILGHNFPESRWYRDAYALLQRKNLIPKADPNSDLIKSWKTTVRQGSI